ncbi:unnamed protein product [Prorocentrum cordatum]|uniref:JmjC domain-containing protein n=1 Tax=Prorocentrum cordatum TaxID=2364126 RepID=A0ABN9UMI3_9DINO|nr:unnamed protein product [Polarella glacialis]
MTGVLPGLAHAWLHDDAACGAAVRISALLLCLLRCRLRFPSCSARPLLSSQVMKNQKEDDVKVPFYHIRLRAGEAVVIPSMAVHVVKGLHSARFSLGVSFEPRFGQMAWPGAPSHFQGLQRPSVGAMRVLWARSTKRLWDAKKVILSRQSSVMDVL